MVAAAAANLRWLLRPVQELLDDPQMTDFFINSVDAAFVDRGRGMERITLPYTLDQLEDIAVNAAALTRQDIGDDVPLVMTKFPGGQRVQIIRPPAIADGQYSFSIRRPSARTRTPKELESDGVFDDTVGLHLDAPAHQNELMELYRARRWRQFLELAVTCKLNIVFSGSVGTGKTFDLRAFTHAIPLDARIVTIEDMEEIIALPHPNVVNLIYSKGGQSIANVTASELVAAAMRMNMDYLLVQELRDGAAHDYLSVLDSGHASITTTHADFAGQVIPRICGLVKKHEAGRHLDYNDVFASLTRSIDVIAHCVREGKRRRVEQILYDPTLKERYATRSAFAVAAE